MLQQYVKNSKFYKLSENKILYILYVITSALELSGTMYQSIWAIEILVIFPILALCGTI